MKFIFTFLAVFVYFMISAILAFAAPNEPVAVVGNVTYNYTGSENLTSEVKANMVDFYANFFEGYLANGGVSIGARGDALEAVKRMRAETNQLNGGLGGWDPEVDANGNFFGGQYIKYEGVLPTAPYRIDATINVWELPNSIDKFDMNFNVRIIDVKTGEIVGNSSVWKRNTEKYVNERVVGHEPTWWEKYISGYVREIKYEDPLRMAMAEASKTVIDKLSILNDQKITSDVDRFLKNIEDWRVDEAQIETGNVPVGNLTAWGSAQDWETAYEGYFWMHVQDPVLYPNFWETYNSQVGMGAILKNLPLGEPVNLRDYFSSPEVREYYELLRLNKLDMPTLDEFVKNIDAYQANIGAGKADDVPEKKVEATDDQEASLKAFQREKEYEQWLKCIGRPIPKTRAELDAREKEDSDPSSPCYDPNPIECKKAANGTCLPDILNTSPR